MALEMKASCEKCHAALAHTADAWICSFECTFCTPCTLEMSHVCPNCGGALEPRPKRGQPAPAARTAQAVLEVAVLEVRPGESEAFQAAFLEAQKIIAASPGYQRHELRRCHEAVDRHLLLVWWDDLESHTKGFRGSEGYQQWRALLHHFYDPFPTVEHYEGVEGAAGSARGRGEAS